MFDERAFIARMESADVDAFADFLEQPTQAEEEALRSYFGNDRYRSMHRLALRRHRSSEDERRAAGNVVVIHGMLGSNLSVEDRNGNSVHVWPNVAEIANGQLMRLKLARDGLDDDVPGDHVRATGIIKRYYGEMLLTLAGSWNTHAYYYDWRKNLDIAADRLYAQMANWFDDDEPVHLVAHGMGGLVARTFIQRHDDRWESMWDRGKGADRAPGSRGGRLVMLSTPNHGSFEVVRTLFGLSRTLLLLANLDLHNSQTDLTRVFSSFVTPWQLLPSERAWPGVKRLYDPKTYRDDLDVSRARLALGREHHRRLRDVVDISRMVCINGSNRPTVDGISSYKDLSNIENYTATLHGDGWVPSSMSHLTASPQGPDVRTYIVDDDHGGLPSNRSILDALDDVLRTGESDRLVKTPAAQTDDPAKAIQVLQNAQTEEDKQFQSFLRHSPSWGDAASSRRWSRGNGSRVIELSRGDERGIQENLARGVLGPYDERRTGTAIQNAPPGRIEIGIFAARIEDFDGLPESSTNIPPVDVISVGLYLGTTPLIETRELDLAISAARPGTRLAGDPARPRESDLLITQFAERGTIRAELGRTFLFDDPRSPTSDGSPPRQIAIVGMGPPGSFGEPELTLLSRELCWTLGQLGKRHLATALIGIGRDNLSPGDATLAFLRGIKHAVTGSAEDERRALTRVTFVVENPDMIPAMEAVITAEQQRLQNEHRFDIIFERVEPDQLEAWRARYRPRPRRDDGRGAAAVSRITVTRKGDRTYRFGAITHTAAIPEREIVIDPSLVEETNDGLVAARDRDAQREEGQVLEKLLLPAELRGRVYSNVPLVLMLDSSMARIHWEMLVQGTLPKVHDANGQGDPMDPDGWGQFLGMARGVTRQLRTTFSQPPDPPPSPQRTMRVLIVADPAADLRLPGAETEGQAIAELFEQFNQVHEKSKNRVEVKSLLGPQEATRKNVMKELLLHSYDVLHFAGHCQYVENKPEESGWIFTNRQLITAWELNRIDRIPNFIFSNACESGVTPDRSERRSAALGPSFAEAFFERGVTNFVCTAWPVDDISAREFAVRLYEQLMGLEPVDATRRRYRPVQPQQMHAAMRAARLRIVEEPRGVGSWGAYQHYGNPYMRFFRPAEKTQETIDQRESP